MSKFSIRPAETGDFDAYMDAFEAVAAEGRWMGAEAPVDREARRPTFERAVAGERSVLFLADAGGGIVGGVYAALSGGVVDLGMFVAAGHRGSGVGSALLEAVIGWARAQRAHKISLAAWPTNHPAIGLYARYGFRVEGTRRRHYRRRNGELWDSVVMGLVLDEVSAGGPGRPAVERPPIVLPDGGIRGTAGGGGAGNGGAAGEILLREWHRADVDALVALLDPPALGIQQRLGDWVAPRPPGDPEMRRWLEGLPDPYTPSDAEEYIAGSRVALTAGTAAALAIVVDGALAGSAALRLDAADPHIGDVGYWVAAAARGRGVASTATRLLCDFGFGTLGLRRIELNAAVANTASRRVAENAGFELEGVRRSWRTVGGVPTDFAHYSRIAGPA